MLNMSPPDDLPGALQLLAPGLTSHDLGFSPIHPILQPIRPPFPRSVSTNDLMGELRLAKREIEMLKTMVCRGLAFDSYASVNVNSKDPFRVADMAVEIQVERMKFAEASSARDSAIQRLSSAYDSIKDKAVAIAQLQSEKADLERRIAESEVWMSRAVDDARVDERRALEGEIGALKELIKRLNDEIRSLKGEEGAGTFESPSEMTLVASPTENLSIANSSQEELAQRDRVCIDWNIPSSYILYFFPFF